MSLDVILLQKSRIPLKPIMSSPLLLYPVPSHISRCSWL